MYFKDEGIILNSYNSSDADKIVEILLKNRGRNKVVFKGIKKSKSTKLNSADLGNFVEVFLYKKNNEQMPYVREIKVRNHFSKIKNDHIKFLHLNYICELFLNMAHFEEANIKLFNFLYKVLRVLLNIETGQLGILLQYIKFRLIQVSGIMPDFNSCHSCHTASLPLKFFSQAGEIICQACEPQYRGDFVKIDKGFTEQVFRINDHRIEKIGDLIIQKKYIDKLDKVFTGIIINYINRDLKSHKILYKMMKDMNI